MQQSMRAALVSKNMQYPIYNQYFLCMLMNKMFYLYRFDPHHYTNQVKIK